MALSKFPIGDGVDGVKTTLLHMKQMVIGSDKFRIVKETAKNIISQVPPSDLLMQAKVITGWVRRNLSYCRDIYGVEELTNPATVLYNIKAGKNGHSSDCDDYAILLAALFRAVGFPTRLEAVAVGEKRYNHARVSVAIGDTWFPVEGTRNTEVGVGLQSELQIMSVEI